VTIRSSAARALLALAAAATLYLLALGAHQRLSLARATWPKLEERVAVPPPATMRVLAGGFNEALADFYWARTLVYYGGGMAQGSSLRDVDGLLALVNALDPKFRRPYVWGAYATTFRQSTLRADEVRASIAVLERGIEAFPQDWELHWILGLRYYLDLKVDDPAEQRALKEKGVAHIETAMRSPKAPANIATLAASLRTQLGQKERALRELREMILNTEDERARAELLDRYRAMASEGTAEELAREGKAFEARWTATLPYAPPSLFVLVGAPPPRLSPRDLLGVPLDLLAEPDGTEKEP
jgi:hypothetical protein